MPTTAAEAFIKAAFHSQMNRFPLIAALIACAAVFILMIRLGKLEGELKALKNAHPNGAMQGGSEGPGAAELEVAVYMGRIETYMNKLWMAGQADNAELVNFYRHEMKEAMEDLVKAGIVDEGVPVSEHMMTYGIKELDALKAKWKAEGLKDFTADYETLVNTCNSCHATCGYGFIRVRIPSGVRYDDQDFAPIR